MILYCNVNRELQKIGTGLRSKFLGAANGGGIGGTSLPPGWKSVGVSPFWKKFSPVPFFISTNKWPEFEIHDLFTGGGN